MCTAHSECGHCGWRRRNLESAAYTNCFLFEETIISFLHCPDGRVIG